MIRLRTLEGLVLDELWSRFSDLPAETLAKWKESTVKALDRLQQNKMVVVNDNRVLLTREGKIFADGIAAGLFVD